MELRYEDLVLDPEGSLRKISEFVDLPYDDAMLRYHEKAERRLQEMARELPEQGGKTRLSVERRMATHARTTEPPDPERVTRWRNEMSADDRPRSSRSPGTCWPSWVHGGPPPQWRPPGGSGAASWRERRGARTSTALALRAREIRRAGPAPAASPPATWPAPFVVGATRSGTTLLRLMLDAHPEMAIPSETTSSPT